MEFSQFVGDPLDGPISCTNTFECNLQLQLQRNEFSKNVRNDSVSCATMTYIFVPHTWRFSRGAPCFQLTRSTEQLVWNWMIHVEKMTLHSTWHTMFSDKIVHVCLEPHAIDATMSRIWWLESRKERKMAENYRRNKHLDWIIIL